MRRIIFQDWPRGTAAVPVCRDALESLHRRMRVLHPGGEETGLGTLVSAPAHWLVTTVTVPGTGRVNEELSLPYHGEGLRGGALLRRLEAWADNGVIEPSYAPVHRCSSQATQTSGTHRLPATTSCALRPLRAISPVRGGGG